MPQVSVVIPCYNAAATLPEAIRSLLGQAGVRLEVVVVDDGSRDDTPAVLAGFAHDARVRVIRQPNGGLGHARNTGCRAARAPYVAFLDADDLARPGRLALQAAVLDAFPEVVLCASEFAAFGPNGWRSERHARTYYSLLGSSGNLARLLPQEAAIDAAPAGSGPCPVWRGHCAGALIHGNFLHPPTLMFRREVFDLAGAFDPALGQCDWEWLTRAATHGEVAYIDLPLIDYRLSPSQMSAPVNRRQIASGILAVRRKVLARSAGLDAAQRRRLRADLGDSLIDSADALVDTDRRAARSHLVEALGRGCINRRWLKVGIKAVLPRAVLAAVRRAPLRP